MGSSPDRTGRTLLTLGTGLWVASMALATLTAHGKPEVQPRRGWWQAGDRLAALARGESARTAMTAAPTSSVQSLAQPVSDLLEGARLFEEETFGGNGRTCLTCHSRETGTVSPADARARFRKNPDDPLFVHDGSDDDDGDGFGDGQHVTRMLENATILMRIPLHANVEVKGHPEIREVTVRRGIPTTLNTPALDPVLMLDGRQPTLQEQALGAITQHAQATRAVTSRELDLIASFQRTAAFFSSLELLLLSRSRGHNPPELPAGPYGVGEARPGLLRGPAAGFQRESAELQARRVRRLSQRPAAESDQPVPARSGSAGHALPVGAGVGVQCRRESR